MAAPWFIARSIFWRDGPLSLFPVPPGEVPLVGDGESLDVALRVVCSPTNPDEEEAYKKGQVTVSPRLNTLWGPTPFPTARGEYSYIGPGPCNYPFSFALKKLNEDDIGKEIEFTGRFPTIPRQYWGNYRLPPTYGVYDLHPMVICYMLYHGAFHVALSPVYAAINSFAYGVGRDEIEEAIRARGDIKLEELIRQAVTALKEGASYGSGIYREEPLKLPDTKYYESSFPDIIAAAEPFSATHRFVNRGDPGKAELQLTSDGVMSTIPFDANVISSFSERRAMPWDDLSANYFAQLFSPLPIGAKITKLILAGREYEPLDIPAILTDTSSFSGFIKAGFPDLKLLLRGIPDIFAAAEEFTFDITPRNEGFIGETRVLLNGEVVDERRRAPAGFTTTSRQRFAMPWDDASLVVSAEVLGRGKEWTETDRKEVKILAGFPSAALGDIDAPIGVKPGDMLKVRSPVMNTGFRGDVGVRIIAPGFEREIMHRIDKGAIITPTFDAEMPVVESFSVAITPIHLGRNRTRVLGSGRLIEIKPLNCLFHWENEVDFLGGYPELNTFTGFVAGKNVRVKGISAIPGTGGPLGGLIPYGGYVLSGDLGPGDVATIEFDELYFLRIETARGIATARLGNLLERDTKLYDYSTVPTPAMMFQSVNMLTTSMRKVAPRLELAR